MCAAHVTNYALTFLSRHHDVVGASVDAATAWTVLGKYPHHVVNAVGLLENTEHHFGQALNVMRLGGQGLQW